MEMGDGEEWHLIRGHGDAYALGQSEKGKKKYEKTIWEEIALSAKCKLWNRHSFPLFCYGPSWRSTALLQNGHLFISADAFKRKAKTRTLINILLIAWVSETQSAYISLVSVFLRKSARIRGFDLFLSHLRQRTAMTTVATMTTKPAKAEPMMRGSWSCTERSGSSATRKPGTKFRRRTKEITVLMNTRDANKNVLKKTRRKIKIKDTNKQTKKQCYTIIILYYYYIITIFCSVIFITRIR